jgi:hypothetical protein
MHGPDDVNVFGPELDHLVYYEYLQRFSEA